ncbi:MAG: hypothetical protein ACRDJU_08445 [Actinomycetota bacterium]
MNQTEAVAGLDSAKSAFVEAIEAVPGDALAFRNPGEDYSLGGLIAHNVGVVQHYRMVLGEVVGGGFTETRPQDPPGFWEEVGARSKSPLPAAGLPAAPPDILGWVRDHYSEHVPHVRELRDAWQQAQPQ